MTAWNSKPFESVVRSRGAGARGLPQSEWLQSGPYPVIGQGAEYVEGWTDRADLLVSPGSGMVLYGGHTRRAKFVDVPFVPGPNVKLLEVEPSLDAKYLFHFLTYAQVESKGYADHFPEVRRLEIPLPPPDEQRRISTILDKAEFLRAKRGEASAQLDGLARSIFVEMFGDPTRPESLGKIQTAKTKLGNLVKIRTGKLDANAAVPGAPYPFFTCAVKNLEIDIAAFDCKAVLVAGNGDLNVKYYEGKFNAYQRTYVIQSLNEGGLHPKFLFQFLDLYVAELRKQAIGGVIKYIKLPYLTEAPVNLPPRAEQLSFVARLDAVRAAQEKQAESASESAKLFQILQHRAFSGVL